MVFQKPWSAHLMVTLTTLILSLETYKEIHWHHFSNLPRLCTSRDLMQKKWTHTKKDKKRKWYPMETITDVDYIDYLALLTNTPVQLKSLLHGLDQEARDICHYLHPKKTEFMRWASEISWPVYISQEKYLIYWKQCQHTHT